MASNWVHPTTDNAQPCFTLVLVSMWVIKSISKIFFLFNCCQMAKTNSVLWRKKKFFTVKWDNCIIYSYIFRLLFLLTFVIDWNSIQYTYTYFKFHIKWSKIFHLVYKKKENISFFCDSIYIYIYVWSFFFQISSKSNTVSFYYMD